MGALTHVVKTDAPMVVAILVENLDAAKTHAVIPVRLMVAALAVKEHALRIAIIHVKADVALMDALMHVLKVALMMVVVIPVHRRDAV